MQINPPKIVVIGAGSAVFGLGALSTIIQHPAMRGAQLALCDINAEGLRVIDRLAEIMNRAWDAELHVDAALADDRELALQALLLDPMVTDIDSGRAILDDLLIEFSDYLPQFR